MVEAILNRLQDILMLFTLCKAASVKDRAHLTCCERLKWMAHNRGHYNELQSQDISMG